LYWFFGNCVHKERNVSKEETVPEIEGTVVLVLNYAQGYGDVTGSGDLSELNTKEIKIKNKNGTRK
jgi:hypothetical protein